MLAALVFEKELDKASEVHKALKKMGDNDLVKIEATAVVVREYDGDPKLRETTEWSGKSGAGWGAFWGVIVGLVFAGPLAGLLAGAGLGALFGVNAEKAIDPDFLRKVGKSMKPGDSAVFAVVTDGDPYTLEQLGGFKGTLFTTELTPDGQHALHKAVEHAELAAATEDVADYAHLQTVEVTKRV